MQTLSLREAAAMLNTTPETVSAMIRNKQLPAAHMGELACAERHSARSATGEAIDS